MEHLKRSSKSKSVIGFASLDSAAKYLGMHEKEQKSACKAIAETIKDKTVDELRVTCGIVFHGFTASEENDNHEDDDEKSSAHHEGLFTTTTTTTTEEVKKN